jgi:hypothetical protein
MSVVNIQLVQLITGRCVTAALNRWVLPTIQEVKTPPPEEPVTNRLSASTLPFWIAVSTMLIRSS